MKVSTLALLLPLTLTLLQADPAPGRHRLAILADMGNEPDEEQQMAHMLACCNEFELEALIAVTGKYLRETPEPERFHKLIDAYALVVGNLRKHAEGWPDPKHLHRITAAGNVGYGIAAAGPGKSSEGSRLLLDALGCNDPRPLHVVVNAGSNTLAQALLDYEADHTAEQTDAAVARLRVFENGAQDNSGAWIVNRYPDIHWIRSNYQTYCYGGPVRGGSEPRDRLGPNTWEPYAHSALGQHHWALEHVISGHGALGTVYPLRLFRKGQLAFIEGGGTIPWMGLVSAGLYHPDHPHWGSWSGRFSPGKAENHWSRHKDVARDEKANVPFRMIVDAGDSWTEPETGDVYDGNYAPVWRWRRAMFNDFRARMDWCTKPLKQANHHPVIEINGDAVRAPLRLDAKAGSMLKLDASGSKDPDGNELAFRWFVYPESGTFTGEVPVDGADSSKATVRFPADAAGKQIHVILALSDRHPEVPLSTHRRVVIDL